MAAAQYRAQQAVAAAQDRAPRPTGPEGPRGRGPEGQRGRAPEGRQARRATPGGGWGGPAFPLAGRPRARNGRTVRQVSGALLRSTVRNSRIQAEWSGHARDDTSVPSTTASASWKVAPAVCMSSSSAG